MPKITTHQYKIRGKYVDIATYYNRTNKFFAKGIPDDVLAFQKKAPSYFETEDELDTFVRTSIQEYHEKIKSSRKIIAYKLNLSSDLRMNKIGDGHWSGSRSWLNDAYAGSLAGDGYGFSIEWEMLIEVSSDKVRYNRIREDGSIGFETYLDQRTILKWTPKREAAFKEIDAAIESMVKKIGAVLLDEDKTVKLLDSGVRLLPE